jgi:hypothetical protein
MAEVDPLRPGLENHPQMAPKSEPSANQNRIGFGHAHGRAKTSILAGLYARVSTPRTSALSNCRHGSFESTPPAEAASERGGSGAPGRAVREKRSMSAAAIGCTSVRHIF